MWLSDALVTRQTASPYLFLLQQQQRQKKDEEENPQVNLAGRGQGQCGGEMLKKQFPSSSPQHSTLEPGPTTSQVSNGCKLDNHKHLR